MKPPFLLVCLVLLSLCAVGCDGASTADGGPDPVTDGGSSGLPPDDPAERAALEMQCGCQPIPAGERETPSGSPELWCYDGCNWCGCTSDGLGTCTARACPDGGVAADGG